MSYNTTPSSSASSTKDINAQDCCFSFRKVTRAVTQFYDRHLEGADIRSTQFTLLLTLSTATGKTLTEMAEGLVMDRTTLTRNLKPLEKSGFIATVKLSDRRSKGYVLTDKGRETMEKGIPLWRKAQQHIVGQLGNERYNRLLEELKAVCAIANVPKSPRSTHSAASQGHSQSSEGSTPSGE